MVISVLLSEPVTVGLVDTTRILYPVPFLRMFTGSVAWMVSALLVFNTPILSGFEKLPVLSESWAIK